MLTPDQINETLTQLFLKISSFSTESLQASEEYIKFCNLHLVNDPAIIVNQCFNYIVQYQKENGHDRSMGLLYNKIISWPKNYLHFLFRKMLAVYPSLKLLIDLNKEFSVEFIGYSLLMIQENQLGKLLENENAFKEEVLAYFVSPLKISKLSEIEKEIILNTTISMRLRTPANPEKFTVALGIMVRKVNDKVCQQVFTVMTLMQMFFYIKTKHIIEKDGNIFFKSQNFSDNLNKPNLQIEINPYCINSKSLLQDLQIFKTKQIFKTPEENDPDFVKKIRLKLNYAEHRIERNFASKEFIVKLIQQKIPLHLDEQDKFLSKTIKELFGIDINIVYYPDSNNSISYIYCMVSPAQKDLFINLQRLVFYVNLRIVLENESIFAKMNNTNRIKYLEDTSYQSQQEYIDKKIIEMNRTYGEIDYYLWIYNTYIKSIVDKPAEIRYQIINDYARNYAPTELISESGILPSISAVTEKILYGLVLFKEKGNIPFLLDYQKTIVNRNDVIGFEKKPEELQCLVTITDVKTTAHSIKTKAKQWFPGVIVSLDNKIEENKFSQYYQETCNHPGLIVNVRPEQIICSFKDPNFSLKKLEGLSLEYTSDEIVKSLKEKDPQSKIEFNKKYLSIAEKLKKSELIAKGETYAMTNKEILFQIQLWCKLTSRAADEKLSNAFFIYNEFMQFPKPILDMLTSKIEKIGGTVGEFIQLTLPRSVKNKMTNQSANKVNSTISILLITTLYRENVVAIEAKLTYRSIKMAIKLQYEYFKRNNNQLLPIVVYNNKNNTFIKIENIETVETYLKREEEYKAFDEACRQMQIKQRSTQTANGFVPAVAVPTPMLPKISNSPTPVKHMPNPVFPPLPVAKVPSFFAQQAVAMPGRAPFIDPSAHSVPNLNPLLISERASLVSEDLPALFALGSFEKRENYLMKIVPGNSVKFHVLLYYVFLLELISGKPLVDIKRNFQKYQVKFFEAGKLIKNLEIDLLIRHITNNVMTNKIVELFKNKELMDALVTDFKIFQVGLLIWYKDENIKSQIGEAKKYFIASSIKIGLEKAIEEDFSYVSDLDDPDILIESLRYPVFLFPNYMALLEKAPKKLFSAEKGKILLYTNKNFDLHKVLIRYSVNIPNQDEQQEFLMAIIAFYVNKVPRFVNTKTDSIPYPLKPKVNMLSAEKKYNVYLFYYYTKLNSLIDRIHLNSINHILSILPTISAIESSEHFSAISEEIESWLTKQIGEYKHIAIDVFAENSASGKASNFLSSIFKIVDTFKFETESDEKTFVERLYQKLEAFIVTNKSPALRDLLISENAGYFVRFFEKVIHVITLNENTKTQFIKMIFNPFLEIDFCKRLNEFKNQIKNIHPGLISLIYKNFGLDQNGLGEYLKQFLDNLQTESSKKPSATKTKAKEILISHIQNVCANEESRRVDAPAMPARLPSRSPSPAIRSMAFFNPDDEGEGTSASSDKREAHELEVQDSSAKRLKH